MAAESKLFLSHSSQDDAFVRRLQQALADLGQEVWIDSRELRGGDPLWNDIRHAIDEAAAYAVLVSPAALQSKWVGKELRHALLAQEKKGREHYPVIPLALDDAKLGVLEEFFDEEPLYIPVRSEAGGLEAALDAILVALGRRLPAELAAMPQPAAEPLEELVLELGELKFVEREDGVRRASARARLVHQAASAGQPAVVSEKAWRLVAPIGPIEAGELRWYLEQYAIWPSHYFAPSALKVEQMLVEWGKDLYHAALPPAHTANVLQAWTRIDGHAGRRFSILVDPALEDGAAEAEVSAAREAATVLLCLPWELLHDGTSFLFQGATPSRVRRRLPNTRVLDVPVLAPPIRILLVSARPEDEACGYLDHRASALPLVDAMEALPGQVRLTILGPATLPALAAELERARDAREPYHVVHFDGHGMYNRQVDLGGLCFEHPADAGKLEGRRHITIHTNELGPLLHQHRIPLVFLEACQSAQAEQASESVASELLKLGVASVVAMSHSVLVETSRRFVEAFYGSLAKGKRVGDAMLAGQRALKHDPSRGRIFGAGELRLEDWFVPVLFQEKDDPQLFRAIPAAQTRADFRSALERRLGALPSAPATGFVGRSRELLALERLLRADADNTARYAVLRGQGGEGKTALAAEFARWMVRSQQFRRAAFVSVETHHHVHAVLDALGRQLVGDKYSVAAFDDLEQAILPVERALAEQPCLLVVDNLERILPPPFLAEATPEALAEDAARALAAILALCSRLAAQGQTRLLFTSREALPAPFDAPRQRRELHRLAREDAVKLIERVLDAEAGPGGVADMDAAREEIEQLVDAVHGHARTLALLAPAIRRQGVAATRDSLVELMAAMEKQFPGSREQSVFASVELSLRRLSPDNWERARALGVFHGGVQLGVLRHMMGWEDADVASLARELVETGLATADPYHHLSLNPALCPYLRERLEAAEAEALAASWVATMRGYVGFLDRQQHINAQLAATMIRMELPNVFALLDLVEQAGNAEASIDLTASLYSLLQGLGKAQLLARVGHARDAAAKALETRGGAWNHALFSAASDRIDQQLADGQLRDALDGAQALLARARAAGEPAYAGADYDLAGACWLLARILQMGGGAEPALPLLTEARQRFEAFVQLRPGAGAEHMASACFAEQGDCLLDLGRLDKAASAYEESIRRAERLDDARQVAVGKGQLGTVRLAQRRYAEALAAYAEARERFTALGEPGGVAVSWHQTGIAHQEASQPEAAEAAYRQSLAIAVWLGNAAGQASTLGQLGTLYDDLLDRPEEAAAFYRQAADRYVEIGDTAGEGRQRNNLADTLRKLHRLDEAREEIRRAIECKAPFGHAAAPWTAWAILADIEADAGHPDDSAAARSESITAYLAYRRDGGENHDPDGRLALTVTQGLLTGQAAEVTAHLDEFAADPELADRLRPFVHALQAIAAGSRDRHLTEAPDLYYRSAAEILLLIDTLEAQA